MFGNLFQMRFSQFNKASFQIIKANQFYPKIVLSEMQIQSQPQTSLSLNHHQLTGSSMNAILKNAYIDKSNTSELLSEEYLRNYTYLEYSMFPELFPCYLGQLGQEEVKGLLDSYLGTFIEFFIEGTNFQMTYEGILSSPRFVEMFKAKYRCEASLISDFGKQIHLWSSHENKEDKVYKLEAMEHRLDILRDEHQLRDIVYRISQHPIADSLFDLICTIVKFIISKDWHLMLSRFTPYKYIVYSALWKITRNKRWDQQSSENSSLPHSVTMENIAKFTQIYFIPFEMELNDFMQSVTKGETKNSVLAELGNKGSDNARCYMEFLGMIKNVNQGLDRLRNNGKTHAIVYAESTQSPIESLNSMIQKLESWTRPMSQKPSQNQSLEFSYEDQVNTRHIDAMKELSYENVENIAKMLARINIDSMELNEVEGIDDKRDVVQSKALSNRCKERDMRQSLDSEFLTGYKLMCTLLSNLTQLSQIKNIQSSPLLKSIQSLFELLNTSLCNIYRLPQTCITQTNQKAQSLSYECSMLIEAINAIEDRIKGLSSEKSLNELKDLLSVREKLYKVKNSLLTNVLSLRILASAFGVYGDRCDEGIKMSRQEEEQCRIRSMDDISKLFATIMQFSAESSTFLNLSNASSSQSKQQITTLPCLQNILLLFGSIQLWHELSLTLLSQSFRTERSNQISQFTQDVVKQYSQQYIKIDSEQVVFVERILTLMQVFENQEKDLEISHANQILGKLCEMKRNKGLHVIDVVNGQKNISALLELLALKLLAACFPKEQSPKGSKPLNQTSHKMPFWKIVTLSEIEQQLSSNQLLQHVINSMSFGQSKQLPIAKDLLQTIMHQHPQVSTTDLFQIFIELKGKYLCMLKHKQQLKACSLSKQSQMISAKKGEIIQSKKGEIISAKKGEINSVFKEQAKNAMSFYFYVVEVVYNSFSSMSLLSNQVETFSGDNYSLAFLVANQLNALAQDLNQTLQKLAGSIITQIIQPKLNIFKPSPQQVSQLLSENALEPSEENNNKLTERMSEMHKFYSHYVDFGMFALGFLSWAALETNAKLELLGSTYHLPKQIHPKISSSSTYHLLQMVTSLSLCTGENFHLNFQSLQSYLQSGIQPIFKQPQPSVLSSYRFPPLPLQAAVPLIEHLGSFQFLQFVYEFIPFGIESEEEEMRLYNLSTNYALHEDNHQFLNPQKTQKIRINRISHFLQQLAAQKSPTI